MDDALENHEDFNELGDQSISTEDSILKNTEKPVGNFHLASSPEVPNRETPSVAERLQEIMRRDEQYAGTMTPEKEERQAKAKSSPDEMKKYIDEMRLANRVNKLEIQAMLDSRVLKTASDFNTAAVIFQHGFSPEDSRMAFELSLKAIGAGQQAEASLVPAAFDRFIIQTQLDNGVPIDQVRQRFGTQTYPDSKGDMFKPALDGQATPDELHLFGIHLPDSDQPADNVDLDQGKILASLRDKLNTYDVGIGDNVDQASELDKLVRLLRTPEEEAKIAAESDTGPTYKYEHPVGEREIAVHGFKHSYDFKEVEGIVNDFTARDPDILLVEGSVDAYGEILFETPDAAVIRQYGEQVYMAWLARKNGKEVKSWDVPFEQQLEAVRPTHTPDAIMGWILAQGSKHLHDSGRPVTPSELLQVIEVGLKLSPDQLREQLGVAITPEYIESLAQKYAGVPFADISKEDLERLSTPRNTGETNNVARDMLKIRDTHALKVIAQSIQQYKKVFITGGAGHAISWEPAIKSL